VGLRLRHAWRLTEGPCSRVRHACTEYRALPLHGLRSLLLLLLMRRRWWLLLLLHRVVLLLLLLLLLLMAPKRSVQRQHSLLHRVQLILHRPHHLTLPADLLAAQAPQTLQQRTQYSPC
jgi:hypothetical protein